MINSVDDLAIMAEPNNMQNYEADLKLGKEVRSIVMQAGSVGCLAPNAKTITD